ncbi:E3 ubiquitin-protein ligase AMFR-like isoform X4 [Nymphalis io]|uniref:E3 ubiquitin-protein ligase AMFR-like isoform X4 n=1 Tax=Inachis io TaxID=171585 RepID=UPI0021673F43|nr:E3 ubiquitin-protein ligase AMFR-like isoform X4 [Nymphalis io]
MPVTIVNRMPLPNLKVYSAGSVLLLSVAMYYAVHVTSDPNWKANTTLQKQEAASGSVEGEAAKMVQPAVTATVELPMNETKNFSDQFLEVMTFMMQEPLCMWTLINMAYCSLVLLGVFIQKLVFGKLRVSEAQRVKDKFWNYLFYKFIFVFGVLNVQYMDEVLLWCSWFTLVGFLHLLGQLCKDRFDYLASTATTSRWASTRVLGLLIGILAAACALFVVAVVWGLPAGKDTFAFMAAECLLLGMSALHVLARFVLRAHDADAAGPASYYTHLVFDAASLVTETIHVTHMVVYSNVVVSMASLVLLMQLRHLLYAMLARLRRHRLYAALSSHMSRNYPMASAEEVLKHEDNCAICWEPMKEARKLPCSHLFHNSCLCRWVQQDASCPTCRRALSASGEPHAPLAALVGQRPNHLFHFDGSRYVSWLPSFSVEVTHGTGLDLAAGLGAAPRAGAATGTGTATRTATGAATGTPAGAATEAAAAAGAAAETGASAEADALVEQVQRLFPQYPRALLAADLAVSRSAHLTIDNILEGRLPPPPAAPDRARPADADSPPPSEAQQESDSAENSEAGQFSASAAEREATLRRRKDELRAAARERYLRRRPARPAPPARPARPAPAERSPRS